MSQEHYIPPPSMAATHEEFAAWLLSNQSIRDEITTRLGNKTVNIYAEIGIEEGEEKVFLKECETCELPKITHSSVERPTCLFINSGIEAILNTVNDLFNQLIRTPEDKENLSVALMEVIEKLPEFGQAKTLLEELKTRTCIYAYMQESLCQCKRTTSS